MGRRRTCRTVGAFAARGRCGACDALSGGAWPGSRRPGVVCVIPARCFWGVRGCSSRGDSACCARGAKRPGVVWVPTRACAGGLCGVHAGSCAAGCRFFLFLRWRLRGGSSRGICGGRVSGAVRGSHCGRHPVSGASYRWRLAVSGLGDRRLRRSSGSRRPRLTPGAEPGG